MLTYTYITEHYVHICRIMREKTDSGSSVGRCVKACASLSKKRVILEFYKLVLYTIYVGVLVNIPSYQEGFIQIENVSLLTHIIPLAYPVKSKLNQNLD